MSVYNALKYNVSFANAGSLVLLTTNTISSGVASSSFTTKIDSTYSEYIFLFNNIHPATDSTQFQVNFSTDSGSNYNVTKTTTNFNAYHNEAGSSTILGYNGSWDLAQSTSAQPLTTNTGNDNDQSVSGYLHLFEPSSTTFVKHFISNVNTYSSDDYSVNLYVAGYGNTTSAIDAVQFTMASGNIDSGTIQMFGVVK